MSRSTAMQWLGKRRFDVDVDVDVDGVSEKRQRKGKAGKKGKTTKEQACIHDNTKVLISSRSSLLDAEKLCDRFIEDNDVCQILTCEDMDFFSKANILSSKKLSMYIMVDSSLCDILMNKRRLHDCVDESFEEFAKSSKVYLINRLPGSEQWRYLGLKFQLPQECVRDYIEIDLSTCEDDSTVLNSPDSDSYESNVSQEEEPRIFEISDSDEEDSKEKDNKLSHVDSQMKASISEALHVQVGYKCQMDIEKHVNRNITVRQDGVDNIVNVKIVAQPSVAKVIVVITTDPKNPGLEKLLEHEIDEQKQVINLRLRNHEATIVDIRPGSIIIEIEAKPGKKIGSEWMKNVIETIFMEDIQNHLGPGVHLKLNVDSTFSIPLPQFDSFRKKFQEKDAELHKNCVSREKYMVSIKELQEMKDSIIAKDLELEKHVDCISRKKYEAKERELEDLKMTMIDYKEKDVSRCKDQYDSALRDLDEMKKSLRTPSISGSIDRLSQYSSGQKDEAPDQQLQTELEAGLTGDSEDILTPLIPAAPFHRNLSSSMGIFRHRFEKRRQPLTQAGLVSMVPPPPVIPPYHIPPLCVPFVPPHRPSEESDSSYTLTPPYLASSILRPAETSTKGSQKMLEFEPKTSQNKKYDHFL